MLDLKLHLLKNNHPASTTGGNSGVNPPEKLLLFLQHQPETLCTKSICLIQDYPLFEEGEKQSTCVAVDWHYLCHFCFACCSICILCLEAFCSVAHHALAFSLCCGIVHCATAFFPWREHCASFHCIVHCDNMVFFVLWCCTSSTALAVKSCHGI